MRLKRIKKTIFYIQIDFDSFIFSKIHSKTKSTSPQTSQHDPITIFDAMNFANLQSKFSEMSEKCKISNEFCPRLSRWSNLLFFVSLFMESLNGEKNVNKKSKIFPNFPWFSIHFYLDVFNRR